MKFTKEIKDNWLKALRSGEFKQGFFALHNKASNTYCCIGVLAEITPGLVCKVTSLSNLDSDNPYRFLRDTVGNAAVRGIINANDTVPSPKLDYAAVIPLVEALPTQD